MRYLLKSISLLAVILISVSCKSDKKDITPVEVDYTFAASAGNSNEIVFMAKISGNYDILRWDFGDGQTASGTTNPTHLFPKAGTYTVTLSVWKGLEEFKSTKTVVIEKNIIDFDFTYTADPSNANIINFKAAISGTYTRIVWDFGNGNGDTDKKETSATYIKAGTYSVKLTVWSNNLQFDIAKTITIAKNLLTLSIDANPTSGSNHKYTLKAVIDGQYSNLKWTFRGKEILNSTETPAYFPFKGSYTVTLSATCLGQPFTVDKTISITSDDPDYTKNLVLAWNDEFEASTLNLNFWTVETGIRVNNELQEYTPSGNYAIADGVLTITCKKVNESGTYGSYTSARLKTEGKKSFQYGMMEARLRLPKGKGTWPAFWLLGASISTGTPWPKCGEIDILEYVGLNPLWVQGSLHAQDFFGGDNKNGSLKLDSSNDEGQWHTYGLIWDATSLRFYVDNPANPYFIYSAPATKTANNWPYDSPYFVILNFAFGGDWGGMNGIDKTLDNMKYDIDYVRYYTEQ